MTPRSFDLADSIQLNQLVRDGVDEHGFRAWLARLGVDAQAEVAYFAYAYAGEAYVDGATCDAVAAAVAPPPEAVAFVRRMIGERSSRQTELQRWFREIEPDARARAARFFLHLFARADESRRGACGRPGDCNHDWHRDLLDPAVVEDLLRRRHRRGERWSMKEAMVVEYARTRSIERARR